ncbi:hypothetical protein [Pseudophaeobacter sp. EL27]|uniref:hypothetical protein n=1 Tax=Pseudophaeobacter sp. EL27 TaxID=2107580 RepID=UPI0013C42779|nr:hypothetical protein [Pseudophaeobacter sp. EL27]
MMVAIALTTDNLPKHELIVRSGPMAKALTLGTQIIQGAIQKKSSKNKHRDLTTKPAPRKRRQAQL